MTVSSYSTTASSNTAINGVNISEGMFDPYGTTKNGFY